MVARLWHGYCPTRERADAYEAMLKPELLPGISKKKGYRGSHMLRRDLGHEIEVLTFAKHGFDGAMDLQRDHSGIRVHEVAYVPAEPRGAFYVYADCGGDARKFCSELLNAEAVAATPGIDQHIQQRRLQCLYVIRMQSGTEP